MIFGGERELVSSVDAGWLWILSRSSRIGERIRSGWKDVTIRHPTIVCV